MRALIFTLLLACAPLHAAQYIYDFSAYSNGDIATVSGGDFTTQGTLTSWTRQVVTDGAATGGKTLVVQDDGQDWGDQFSAVVSDEAGATTGDIEVVARMKLGTVANLSNSSIVGPVLITNTNTAYGIRIESTTSIRGTQFDTNGTAFDNIDTTLTVSTIAADYFWVRIGRSGSTIRLKFWLDNESEPGSWQKQGTNTALSSVKAGVASKEYDVGAYTVDVLGIGTDGDAAPISSGGGVSSVPVILQQLTGRSAANDDRYTDPLVANSR